MDFTIPSPYARYEELTADLRDNKTRPRRSPRDYIKDVYESLERLLELLELAQTLRATNEQGGRPRNLAPQAFVIRVADTYCAQFGVLPTTGRSDPFESIVERCFSEIEWDDVDVHATTLKALKVTSERNLREKL